MDNVKKLDQLANDYAAERASEHLKGDEYLQVNAALLSAIIMSGVYRGIAIGLEEGRRIYRVAA